MSEKEVGRQWEDNNTIYKIVKLSSGPICRKFDFFHFRLSFYEKNKYKEKISWIEVVLIT